MAAGKDATEDTLKNMIIPEYILTGCHCPDRVESPNPAPEHPVLVFINSKSGGQQGHHLLASCRVLLSPLQVFDLHEIQPEEVLLKVLSHLETLSGEGDNIASAVRRNLRLICAGGDGSVGWLLAVVGEMKLSHPPPLASVPFGTGNNIPFALGWGKKNPGTDLNSVTSLLLKVAKAKAIHIDSWRVVMRMSNPADDCLDPVVLPHSMRPLKYVSSSDMLQKDSRLTFCGSFWNYFSIGMDAQVSYAFHHQRQEHPEKFKNQLMNQGTYAGLTCAQGWFCVSCFHPSSKNINKLGKIKISQHGDWQELNISQSIRSIVMLNLPSFSGGLNPWGLPSEKKSKERGLTRPYVDDGLIEIVGFRDGWHGMTLFGPNGHGTRLAQTHKVKLELNAVNHAYLRMDGEPWLQPLPADDLSTVIEITHQGQALVLATEDCNAKRSVVNTNTQEGETGVR